MVYLFLLDVCGVLSWFAGRLGLIVLVLILYVAFFNGVVLIVSFGCSVWVLLLALYVCVDCAGCFVVADCGVWLVLHLRCGIAYCCGGKDLVVF